MKQRSYTSLTSLLKNLLSTIVVTLALMCVAIASSRTHTPAASAGKEVKEQDAAARIVPTPTPTPTPATGEALAASSAAASNGVATTTKSVPAQANALADNPGPAAPATAAIKTSSGAIAIPPEKARPIRLPRVDKAPSIDGKLDEEVWKQAAVFKDFYQIDPGDNTPPSHQTEMYLAMDAKFLYFAVRAHDDPKSVRARVAKRDQIFDDDHVGFFLDTYNDRRKGYAIWFNPLGIQADGIKTDGQGEDYSIDLVMESKGTLTDDGFVVEAAIPFKSLRYEAGKDKVWGVHFLRRIKRLNNELNSWLPFSRDINGTFNQAGQLTGLEGIATERNLEIIPSFTLSEEGERVRSLADIAPALDAGRIVNRPIESDFGVTVKYGITPTVTLDFAYNPDFNQVESDAPVVLANQRFPIFFAEKRPFFLEGKDIFNTLNTVVHTRAIVDPDYAAKLTGKMGRNSFGLILASDNAPGNYREDERTAGLNNPDTDARRDFLRYLDKNAFIGVLRLKRDVGKESNIGLFGTTYNFVERNNHVLGFDGRFKLDKQSVASFEVIGTRSHIFDQTNNGFGYSVRYAVDKRHYGFNYDGRGRTQNYRTDVGFVQRTNTNRHGFFAYYSSEPQPKRKLINYFVGHNVRTHFNWQGQQHGWGSETEFNLQFAHQTYAGGGYSRDYERVFEREFGGPGTFFGRDDERSTRINTAYGWVESTLTKKVSVYGFFGNRRGGFDFDFGGGRRYPRVSPEALRVTAERDRLRAAGRLTEQGILSEVPDARLDPGAADSLDINFRVNYKPTNPINLSLDYTRAKLTRRDTGLTAFDDHIFSLRGTYQFTRFTFARMRVDYDTLASSVRGQYLLGWTPNPGTAFYVGYNDTANYNGFNRFNEQLAPGFQLNNRVFFIKASYLFRKSF